jgi:shikimate dehydrogenase
VGNIKKLVLGLIGSDLSNSLSESIHRKFAIEDNLELDFYTFEVGEDDFDKTVYEFFQKMGNGLSITSPYKQTAIRCVDVLDVSAEIAKSVNCITLRDNKLVGHNTDGKGLLVDLKSKRELIKGTRILVLGSGGAVRGILSVLCEEDDLEVSVWARNSNKVQGLSKEFTLHKIQGQYDIIIHATSSKELFDLDWLEKYTTKYTIMYDIQYKNDGTKTWFSQWADRQGYINFDGKGMVYQQAKLAFDIWKECIEG